MFKCGRCKRTTIEGERCVTAPVKTRPRIYETLINKGRPNERKRITRGVEIVREEKLCPKCVINGYSERTSQKDPMKKSPLLM